MGAKSVLIAHGLHLSSLTYAILLQYLVSTVLQRLHICLPPAQLCCCLSVSSGQLGTIGAIKRTVNIYGHKKGFPLPPAWQAAEAAVIMVKGKAGVLDRPTDSQTAISFRWRRLCSRLVRKVFHKYDIAKMSEPWILLLSH